MHKVYQGTSDPDLSEELRFGRVAVLKKEVGRERERERAVSEIAASAKQLEKDREQQRSPELATA
jgi:hypothetical protein